MVCSCKRKDRPMFQWFHDNTAFVSMLTGIVTALIWLVYLQLLVTSQRHQRRPVLTIDRGAGRGMNGRIILTNLGFEAVYVTDIIALLHKEVEQFSANITDRDEVSYEDLNSPLEATLQGPLSTGGVPRSGLGPEHLRSHQVPGEHDGPGQSRQVRTRRPGAPRTGNGRASIVPDPLRRGHAVSRYRHDGYPALVATARGGSPP